MHLLHIVFKLAFIVAPAQTPEPTQSPPLTQSPPCRLAGTYNCRDPQNPYELKITQKTNGPFPEYTFEGPLEGAVTVIADNEDRPIKTRLGIGTVRATCIGGRLEATLMLKDEKGDAFNVKDSMYIERLALVRIRLSLPGSKIQVKQVFVCGPVFPRKNTSGDAQ